MRALGTAIDKQTALLVRLLWPWRPRKDIDGWHASARVTITWRDTVCNLRCWSGASRPEDARRVRSALLATAAGLGPTDRPVRTLDLGDTWPHAEQWRVVDGLLPPSSPVPGDRA